MTIICSTVLQKTFSCPSDRHRLYHAVATSLDSFYHNPRDNYVLRCRAKRIITFLYDIAITKSLEMSLICEQSLSYL